jgi:hypothetical protein
LVAKILKYYSGFHLALFLKKKKVQTYLQITKPSYEDYVETDKAVRELAQNRAF